MIKIGPEIRSGASAEKNPIFLYNKIEEFVIEINSSDTRGVELLSNDHHTNVLLYAGDLSIFADTVADIQRKIHILEGYCTRWNLKVNMAKSKVIVFRNGGYLE